LPLGKAAKRSVLAWLRKSQSKIEKTTVL